MNQYSILDTASKQASVYLNSIPDRRVFPDETSLKQLQELSFLLPDEGTSNKKVLEVLNTIGSINTVASNGGRYFGFVFGGTLPVSLAANWLAGAWDQNAVFKISSPISAQIEKITSTWLLDLLRLPPRSAVGFVTGTTMANFSAVVAARYKICKQLGWDIKSRGMNGAPAIRIVTGSEIHASMQRALLLAGFGLDNLIKIPTDNQGRIQEGQIPELDESTLLCLQAGNVNTGALDRVRDICTRANEKGAWVHIDGAFGMWARVSPGLNEFTDGYDLADSWAIDLHKWLNVPYDSGLVICKEATALQNALSVSAAYLPETTEPEPYFYTPEMSKRARAIDTWAALYSLGKNGVIDLVERCCALAKRFAANLESAGFDILNEVTLNQVLISFGDPEQTNQIIKAIQEDGTCWCGGTVWQGKTAMRISVSSWMTTEDDIDRSSEAIIRIAGALRK